MTPELSSSHSPLSSLSSASAHEGRGGHVDGGNNGTATEPQGYALTVKDYTGSDDAAEKQWTTKWKKHGIGFSFWRTVYAWKLEILSMTVMTLIVVSEVRRLSLDRSLSTTCLDVLPVEELTHFKLPSVITTGPVEYLQYVERTSSVSWSVEESPTASAFTGNQTIEERANSFRVQPTMKVHCGFCDGDNEFYIDARDKAFLAECKIVVLTCAFGGGDDLYQPIGMTEASLSQVCYVAFWDGVTLELQATKGQEPDLQNRQVGLWRVVVVQNLPFSDQRRNGKIPKLLNHRLFPQARYSIWVDSKSQFRRDPIGVIEALIVRPKSVFAISVHGGRSCVYKEGEAIVKKNKAVSEDVAVQLDQYRKEHFPENAQFDGHRCYKSYFSIFKYPNPF